MVKYGQFEHKADIGVRGYGKTIEEAFENGAKALFEIMVNLKKIEKKKKVKIKCQAANLEELFVEWLNALLSEAGIKNLIFSDFKINKIEKENSGYALLGVAQGEKFNPTKHEPKIEAKAATYSQLEVGKKGKYYIAQTIIDV